MSDTEQTAEPSNENVLKLPNYGKGFRSLKQPTKKQVLNEFEKLSNVDQKVNTLYTISQQLARTTASMLARLHKAEQVNDAILPMVEFRLVAILKTLIDKGIITDKELEERVDQEQLGFLQIQEPVIDQNYGLINVDRAVQSGDVVIMSLDGTDKDELPQPELSSKWFQATLGPTIPGFQALLPELAAGLIDMKAGDDKKIAVKFPEAYPVPKFANQEVIFNVKLLRVKQQLPETHPDEPPTKEVA